MPFSTLIVVALIASAFLIFAVTLAYGEYQTRDIKPDQGAAKPEHEREQQWNKAA